MVQVSFNIKLLYAGCNGGPLSSYSGLAKVKAREAAKNNSMSKIDG